MNVLMPKGLVLCDAVRRRLYPVESRILRSEAGEQRLDAGNTLCVFAHFDRDNIVDDYVVHYLGSLAAAGCVTVFVSTAEALDDESFKKIKPYCTRVIVKQNHGHDFASWRTGLAAVDDLLRYERVIIANDSVYGPIWDIGAIIREMAGRKEEFWGITDSRRYGYHLQSYFLSFERPIVESDTFQKFWRSLPDYRSKYALIFQCEVGFSRKLVAAGFKFAAFCAAEKVWPAVSRSAGSLSLPLDITRANLSHWGWKTLIRDAGCPFIKVQLLRDNPLKITDVDEWSSVIGEASNYDVELIRRHLMRMKR